MPYDFIIPVHNGAGVIRKTLDSLRQFCARSPGSVVHIVENGCVDDTHTIVSAYLAKHPSLPASVLSLPERGLGLAYRAGILESLERPGNATLVLSAADLPFGFTDIDSYQRLQEQPDLAIGSKAHSQSQIQRAWSRNLGTALLRKLRAVVLGMQTQDPQGTLILKKSTARALIQQVRSNDFFFSTEMVFLAEQAGFTVVEVPISLTEFPGTRSTVRFARDGCRMVCQLLHLRSRMAIE